MLTHSYTLNVVYSHDDTQKTLYRNSRLLSYELNLAITQFSFTHPYIYSNIYIYNRHPTWSSFQVIYNQAGDTLSYYKHLKKREQEQQESNTAVSFA